MHTIQYSEIRFIGYTLHTTIVYKHPRAQNLRQSIVLKTSFKTRVSRMGLEAVLWISIFLQWNIFFSLFTSSIFFDYLKSKSTQMWRSQKENSRFSFYNTLSNFGLCILWNCEMGLCTLYNCYFLNSMYLSK